MRAVEHSEVLKEHEELDKVKTRKVPDVIRERDKITDRVDGESVLDEDVLVQVRSCDEKGKIDWPNAIEGLFRVIPGLFTSPSTDEPASVTRGWANF